MSLVLHKTTVSLVSLETTVSSVIDFTRNNCAIGFTKNKYWELKPDFLNFLRFAEFKRRKRIVCKANLMKLIGVKNPLVGRKTYEMLQGNMLLFFSLFSVLCYPINFFPLCF